VNTEQLDEWQRITDEATPGPWYFATAPYDPEKQTKAEYVTSALNKWREDATLWTLWSPDPEGEPDDYVIPALTGDGPTSRANAEFIAIARVAMPVLIRELKRLLNDLEK
jgi:hypothetical protein